ncbi:polysaccharide deacetylase family protein [Dyadobacter sandarakinus]|uniref:Polysaccharide deacetylase family protein n=1 Tax=Dyadobacter sandarakinus TaxID=2747268 RepID=A0ABX7IBV1_9BACT|nr:polysaccharide deacetylase family protein [Dyadobacter sandarakinus]QRR03470.1 polysaccharide deacetylase family protein [Dyadobacter sandarakinus]
MRKLVFILSVLFLSNATAQQRSVSITIDDVPNVHLYKEDGNVSVLQRRLDSLQVPVGIFINEVNLKQTGDEKGNIQLLKSWILKPYTTVGNHSYSHFNYGEVGADVFEKDVLKGAGLTGKMLAKTGKAMRYFRFPFNALGKDSAAHVHMEQFLQKHGYISTPFTVESEDWLYTQLYEHALKNGKPAEARQVAERYVNRTLKAFAYFDSLSTVLHGRPVRQIYLCHDNRLNTDYLAVIVQKLKQQQYKMISLEEALEDPLYKSVDYYAGNAGFSWIYRWVQDPSERKRLLRAEPEDAETQRAFEAMGKLR